MKPVFSELSNEAWMMEPLRLQTFFNALGHPDKNMAAVEIAVNLRAEKMNYSKEGRTAVIPIKGILLSTVPDWMRRWEIKATGYDEICQMTAAALADPTVDGIDLDIDSPGGSAKGLNDCAEMLYEAGKKKRMRARVGSLCASAAYYLGSQASEILASKDSEVGSIGVYAVYADWSKADEQMGVKVIVIRSGEHKGMGIDAITDKQISAAQEIIDGLAKNFREAVQRGRGMTAEQVKAIATGRTWLAEPAKELKLIDGIIKGGIAAVNNTIQGEKAMSEQATKGAPPENKTTAAEQNGGTTPPANQGNVPGSIGALKEMEAAFPDHKEYARSCWEGFKSLADAKAGYNEVLQKDLKTAREENAKIKAEADASAKELKDLKDGLAKAGAKAVNVPNTPPVPDGTEAVKAYSDKLEELKKAGVNNPRAELIEKFPAIHKAYIEAESKK